MDLLILYKGLLGSDNDQTDFDRKTLKIGSSYECTSYHAERFTLTNGQAEWSILEIRNYLPAPIQTSSLQKKEP